MKKKAGSAPGQSILRKKAEKKLGKKIVHEKTSNLLADANKLVHELQVHQIELELQNEELIRIRLELETALQKYTDLFEFAPVGYFTVEADGKIDQVNLSGSILLGKTRSLIKNRSFYLFISEKEMPIFENFLTEVFKSNGKKQCELSIIGKEGKHLTVHIEGVVAALEKHCRMSVIDITELRESENFLKEKELLLRESQRVGKLGSYVLDIPLNKWTSSEVLDDIFGISEGYKKNIDNWNAIIHPDMKEEMKIYLKEYVLAEGNTFDKEYKIIRPSDGEIRWLWGRGEVTYQYDGTPVRMIGVIKDITENKIAELKLKKLNEELAELSASKDKFLSLIAHDLKSPFTNILGFSEILLEEAENISPKELKNFAAEVHKSARQIFELLENLLEWAYSQRDKIKIAPVVFNLKNLFDDELRILKINALRKNITLNFALPEHVNIKADKNMFKTILRNIISNAIKYTRKNGNVDVTAEIKSEFAEFSITDDGVGMDKQTLEGIFKMGNKHNSRGTENEKGTGLGLILCREFIQKHNCKLWAESELGKGSTVKFTMPIA
ncbi:MAG: ATP-binding protein [Ignavibacteria bacterium]|nr:ATP-binding protein [Ignavibacteria bacterium]